MPDSQASPQKPAPRRRREAPKTKLRTAEVRAWSEPFAVQFGAEVKERRSAVGMTQEDLADKARVHTNFISLIERGKINVALEAAIRVAEALDIKLSVVLSGFGH